MEIIKFLSLIEQIKKYEDVRANNVKLLNKLQGLQGSIQVRKFIKYSINGTSFDA